MPNCFSLSRKYDVEGKPVAFSVIDEEMCAFFNVPCHPAHYHWDWYNWIGLALAMGRTFQQIRTIVEKGSETTEDKVYSLRVINWLDENFVPDAWAEVGRG